MDIERQNELLNHQLSQVEADRKKQMLQGKKYQEQLQKANSVIEELSQKINSERRQFEELLNNKASDLQIGKQVKQQEIAKITRICMQSIQKAFDSKFENLKKFENEINQKLIEIDKRVTKVARQYSEASKGLIQEWKSNIMREEFINQLNLETQNMSKSLVKKSVDLDSSLNTIISNLSKPLNFSISLDKVEEAKAQISMSMSVSQEAQKSIKNKIFIAQEKLEITEEEILKLKKKLKNEINQNSHLSSKVKEFEAKLDKKQKELIEQMQAFSKAKIEKSKIEKKYFSLKESNKEVLKELDTYRTKVEDQNKELDITCSKLKVSEKAKEHQKIQVEELQKNIEILTLNNKQLQENSLKQIEQLQEYLIDSVEYLRDIDKLENKVKESSKISNFAKENFEEASRRLRSITSCCQNVLNMIKKGCFTQVQQELVASKNEIKMIKSFQSDLIRQLSSTVYQLKSSSDKEKKRLNTIIQKQSDEIQKLNGEFEKEKGTFQLTISDCKSEILKLSKDNQELNNKSDQLASTFKDDKTEIKTYYEQEIRKIKIQFLKILEHEKQAQKESRRAVFNSFRGMVKNSIR